MYNYSGHVGNRPMEFGRNSNDGASLSGRSIASPRSTEGKVAKMFIDKTNVMVFDSTVFAEMVMAIGGNAMKPRVLEIVKGLIRSLAAEYDAGIVNNATVEAKRLCDTLDQWGM